MWLVSIHWEGGADRSGLASALYEVAIDQRTLATVNAIGDFLSSVIVGALWTAFGTSVAFGYYAVASPGHCLS